MVNKTHLTVLFIFISLASSCSVTKEKEPVCSSSDLAEMLAIVEGAEDKTSRQVQIAREERAKVEEIYSANKQLLADLKEERRLIEAEHKKIKQTTKPCVYGNLSDERLKRITPLPVNIPPTLDKTNQAIIKNENKNLELLHDIQNTNKPINPELNDANQIIDPPYAPSDAPL